MNVKTLTHSQQQQQQQQPQGPKTHKMKATIRLTCRTVIYILQKVRSLLVPGLV